MSPLLPISHLTERDIHDAIRNTLRADCDPQPLGEFLAMVDLSGTGDDALRDRIALLIAWTDEYVEGRIGREHFTEHLLSLLPRGVTA